MPFFLFFSFLLSPTFSLSFTCFYFQRTGAFAFLGAFFFSLFLETTTIPQVTASQWAVCQTDSTERSRDQARARNDFQGLLFSLAFFFFVSCRARVVTGLTVSDQGFNYFFKGVDKTNFSKGRNQNVNKQCWVQSRLTVCLH